MIIETGKYYATDYKVDDRIETNILFVLSQRGSTSTEVENTFYVTETMFLDNGEFVEIYKNDWLPEFFEREATEKEIKMFKYYRKLNPNLKYYAETLTGIWLKGGGT